MDAANCYHWKLFERIGDERHDPKQGYEAIDLMIDVKTTYAMLPTQKSKKANENATNTSSKKQSSSSKSNSFANRSTNPSPNTGSFPAGSCPIHPSSTTHNHAGCRFNPANRSAGTSSSQLSGLAWDMMWSSTIVYHH